MTFICVWVKYYSLIIEKFKIQFYTIITVKLIMIKYQAIVVVKYSNFSVKFSIFIYCFSDNSRSWTHVFGVDAILNAYSILQSYDKNNRK